MAASPRSSHNGSAKCMSARRSWRLSNRPTCIQNLTHTDPLLLAGRGAYTRARPDSPHASRSITAPKSYTTELRAGGCPKPTGRRPTDPQPTIATARANPVESNALNGPTRLTATTPRRVRTGSSQLNLRSDGQRLRPSAPAARRCSRWLTRRPAPFDFDATLDFDLNLAPLPFRRQQPSIGVEPAPNPLPRIAMPYSEFGYSPRRTCTLRLACRRIRCTFLFASFRCTFHHEPVGSHQKNLLGSTPTVTTCLCLLCRVKSGSTVNQIRR